MIPAVSAHLHVAAKSHPGLSGKNNEDRYAVSAFQLSPTDPTPVLLSVVADGIGGHRAGEVAAEIAVEIISQVVSESDAKHPTEVLRAAMLQASEAIREQAEADFNQTGMGATCACVWVLGDRVYTASVGDSRIYLIRNQAIRQLTKDHTWIQEALEHGALTAEQASQHPNLHVIRRYLGSKQAAMPDLRLRLKDTDSDLQAERNQGMRIKADDGLLLCSDGLTDLVKDSEILDTWKKMPLEQSVEHLVNLANQRGGHDNITVVAMKAPRRGTLAMRSRSRRFLALTCLGIGFILVVALLTALFLGWYFTTPIGPFTGLEMLPQL